MREGCGAYLRRTEGRLTLIAALAAVSAIVLGVVGMTVLQDRQALLDDAVDRRGALTSAALDIYRTFADADATSSLAGEPGRATMSTASSLAASAT